MSRRATRGWLGAAAALVMLSPSARSRAEGSGGPALAARGDDGGAVTRRDVVVARVGPSHTVTVGELEDAIAHMPSFQRKGYGAGSDALRRGVLEDVLVRRALFLSAAEQQGLAHDPSIAHAIDWAVSSATVRAIRGALPPLTQDDVRAYYDANRARFDSPERVRVARILCKTEDEAKAVLDQARADLKPKTFDALAREHSIDKGSNLKGGDLGFLTADGASADPGLRVDPALLRAVAHVHDGEVAPAPVPEGDAFAVVWRRGTVPAVHRPPTDEGVIVSIRRTLEDERVKQATDARVAALRAAKVRDVDPSPLETLDAVDPPDRADSADAAK